MSTAPPPGTETPSAWMLWMRILTALVAVAVALLALTAYKVVRGPCCGAESPEKPETPGSIASPETGTPKDQATVTRAPGGPVTTKLGYGIEVNKGSTLQREWIAVHPPTLPADLVGTPGITTSHNERYHYDLKAQIKVTAPLSAIEVSVATFNVWGEHVRNLRAEEVVDIEPGVHDYEWRWNVFSENEVSSHYASIVWISKVRTKAGKVVAADRATVIAEAKKLSDKFSPEDLEPEKPKKE